MSETQIKPIKINPELFTVTRRPGKNKTLKKSSTNNNIKPNKLKQDLLTKIKHYRQNKNSVGNAVAKSDGPIINTNIDDINPPNINTFNVINNKKQKNNDIINVSSNSDTNLGDDDFMQSISFLKDLATKNQVKKNNTDKFPLTLANNSNTSNTKNNDQPPFSCLKNSTLPTYREWKNKTLKQSTDSPTAININTKENDVLEVDSSTNEPSTRAKTLKYHLGKKGKVVSILVKNAITRKRITNEHNLLKQTKLSDMKNYLKRHNLLKSGSRAPPDIIKKLYEQALLGGDIRNSNKTNIINNYLAE
jgi:hypothetical protein